MTKRHKGGDKRPDHDVAGQANVDHACLEKAWIDEVVFECVQVQTKLCHVAATIQQRQFNSA